MSKNSVNIGESAGDYQLVSRENYERVYNMLRKMLMEKGTRFVSDYKSQCCKGSNDKSEMDQALIMTIVQNGPNGSIKLLTADEADLDTLRSTDLKEELKLLLSVWINQPITSEDLESEFSFYLDKKVFDNKITTLKKLALLIQDPSVGTFSLSYIGKKYLTRQLRKFVDFSGDIL